MLGAGWYGQGLRLLDISDASDMRQVGYYRVTGTGTDNPSSNSWDMAFYDWGNKGSWNKQRNGAATYIYLFDMTRGVEVLRLRGGATAAPRMKNVAAPSVRRRATATRPSRSRARPDANADGSLSYVCPLFRVD